MKFLIDECLSPKLVKLARDRGREESSHVKWFGRGGEKDWRLIHFILEGDWTFVTRNSSDFRGPASNPGSKGQYAKAEIHAGLVCLNCPDGAGVKMQIEMFERALDDLDVDGDLVNKVLEITLDETKNPNIQRYRLPRDT